MAQYLSTLRPQSTNNTFAVPPVIGATTPNEAYFTTLTAKQLRLPVKTVTADYVVTNQDCVLLCNASNGQITITLPNPSESTGRSLNIKKIDTSTHLVVLEAFSKTIDNLATYQMKYSMESIVVISDGANYFVL